MSTRNHAAATVRACADALIEQAERHARGWDRGLVRDDASPWDRKTISQTRRELVQEAMEAAPRAM